ncbi:MAG: BatA domain-containing protein [Chloroflexia bacterium]
MGILEPAGLLLALLAVPIIVFYMLRLRRQEITVSSSMLWRQVLQDRQANTPWQKLRRNLLLYLQLLVLAMLVFALARPFLTGAASVGGNIVLVLDASASMQARDGANGGTRFAQAQAEATRLVDNLASGAHMTLILAGPTATTIVSSGQDKPALRAAVAGLRASNGPGNMPAAITLAAAAAGAPDTTLVVISDGAVGDAKLPDVTAAVRYVPVGTGRENTAITALALRDAPQGPQLFVGLSNTGVQPASGLLTVETDGRLWDSRQVSLAPGADQALTQPDLPLTTRLVTVTLKTADILPADNTAWAARAPSGSAVTLLVSPGNSFAEKALNLLPQVHLSQEQPATYKPVGGYDLTVFDSYLPAALPPGSLLLINPPDSPLVPVSGTIPYPALGPIESNDPLLRYVNLSNVHIAEARKAHIPPWARTLVRTAGGDPLLLVGETGGRRVAVLTFDLHRSDLALQVAFPILMSNLVGWLAPGSSLELPPRLTVGSALALHPLPEADRVTVTTPAGPDMPSRQVSLPAGNGVSFGDTAELGLYRVDQTAKGKPVGATEYFAVNLLDRAEADIAPRASLELQGHAIAGTKGAAGPEEIAPALLALAMLLLLLEWWVYHHGSRNVLRGLRLRKT